MQLTAEEHFENAEMAFTMENFDLARTSFKRALDMEPEVGGARHAFKNKGLGMLASLCRTCLALPPGRIHGHAAG